MSRHTEAAEATLDALGSPVKNGSVRPTRSRKTGHVRPEARNRPVVQARRPVGPWRCDACEVEDTGWRSMDRHASVTGHRVYSPIS